MASLIGQYIVDSILYWTAIFSHANFFSFLGPFPSALADQALLDRRADIIGDSVTKLERIFLLSEAVQALKDRPYEDKDYVFDPVYSVGTNYRKTQLKFWNSFPFKVNRTSWQSRGSSATVVSFCTFLKSEWAGWRHYRYRVTWLSGHERFYCVSVRFLVFNDQCSILDFEYRFVLFSAVCFFL